MAGDCHIWQRGREILPPSLKSHLPQLFCSEAGIPTMVRGFDQHAGLGLENTAGCRGARLSPDPSHRSCRHWAERNAWQSHLQSCREGKHLPTELQPWKKCAVTQRPLGNHWDVDEESRQDAHARPHVRPHARPTCKAHKHPRSTCTWLQFKSEEWRQQQHKLHTSIFCMSCGGALLTAKPSLQTLKPLI